MLLRTNDHFKTESFPFLIAACEAFWCVSFCLCVVDVPPQDKSLWSCLAVATLQIFKTKISKNRTCKRHGANEAQLQQNVGSCGATTSSTFCLVFWWPRQADDDDDHDEDVIMDCDKTAIRNVLQTKLGSLCAVVGGCFVAWGDGSYQVVGTVEGIRHQCGNVFTLQTV